MNPQLRTVLFCLAILSTMGLLAANAKPLYDAFCDITGFGGETRQSDELSSQVLDRTITVRFDANTSRDLGWEFQPLELTRTVQVGENAITAYRATNTSSRPVVGTATFNVQPQRAGPYFIKVECFCFQEQLLMPGESIDMPVLFYLDPELANERRMDEVREVTLSYTFFIKKDPDTIVPEVTG